MSRNPKLKTVLTSEHARIAINRDFEGSNPIGQAFLGQQVEGSVSHCEVFADDE